jgi:subfamily B ATP-binding cassette protein HlyB/CyaB
VIAVADSAWPRRQIGVVLQENILMNHLVRENIALAGSGMLLDRVVEAAKLAGDHEFILGNPRALATFVKGGR